MPIPATAGSKVPALVSVMPSPVHIPPGVADTRLMGGSYSQKGPAGVMVASGFSKTSISDEVHWVCIKSSS